MQKITTPLIPARFDLFGQQIACCYSIHYPDRGCQVSVCVLLQSLYVVLT